MRKRQEDELLGPSLAGLLACTVFTVSSIESCRAVTAVRGLLVGAGASILARRTGTEVWWWCCADRMNVSNYIAV